MSVMQHLVSNVVWMSFASNPIDECYLHTYSILALVDYSVMPRHFSCHRSCVEWT